jgi:hypothetical protein
MSSSILEQIRGNHEHLELYEQAIITELNIKPNGVRYRIKCSIEYIYLLFNICLSIIYMILINSFYIFICHSSNPDLYNYFTAKGENVAAASNKCLARTFSRNSHKFREAIQ